MSKIELIPMFEEKNGYCNSAPVQKIYTMEGVNIVGQVSPYAVAPLRILTHILKTKYLTCEVLVNDNNPWAIKQILINDKDAKFVKIVLEEIMKYRCAFELGREYETIIRQLPFEVAMRTSEYLIPYPVLEEERKNYEEIVNDPEYIFYQSPPREIPRDQYVLNKHLIYPSSRGGYNIKTMGYDSSSLDHYSYSDSKKWD